MNFLNYFEAVPGSPMRLLKAFKALKGLIRPLKCLIRPLRAL